MKINKNFTRKNDNTGVTVNYETIEECPNCKKALAPQNLYGIVHSRDDKEFLSVADYCNGCHSLIVSEYEICRKVTRTLSDGRKEYITSTEAGKLFNDDGFNETLRKYSNNNGLLKNTNGIQELYEGTNSSGEISFYNNGKEIKVKAFNDYFSEEYIRNIRCSEVKTIFTGDYLAKNGIGNNAFCRTELNLLLGDNCIETINEIDKNIIKEIMAVAPE